MVGVGGVKRGCGGLARYKYLTAAMLGAKIETS